MWCIPHKGNKSSQTKGGGLKRKRGQLFLEDNEGHLNIFLPSSMENRRKKQTG